MSYMERHESQFDHNDKREELESIHSQGKVDGPQSFDPKGEKQRPAFERATYKPKVCSFNQIMELWAIYEGGPLIRVLHVPSRGDDLSGEDTARRAWEWVSLTPGWSETIREVMRHIEVRQKGWADWPSSPPSTSGIGLNGREFCAWPFLTKSAARDAWEPFARALRKRYREVPFTILEQEVEMA